MLTRIIVCGGRNADIDPDIVDSCISDVISDIDGDIEFVSGAARGGDALGETFARIHGFDVVQFKPDWTQYGRSAGPIRNHQMIDYINECDNPIVIAFWDGKSRGTRDTIKTAQRLQIPVHIIRYTDTPDTIESGIQFDGENITYNWNEDDPEDILPLVNQKTVQTRKQGHAYFYSFRANKTDPKWKSFLATFKHSGDEASLKKLASQVANRLFATYNEFDCIIYPKSSSKLNQYLIDAIHEIDPYMPAYSISKVKPSDIQVDWDMFNERFKGDPETVEKNRKKLEQTLDRIHRSDNFSLHKQVPPIFRKFFKGFLDVEDLGDGLDDIIAAQTILVLDDIVTSGRTSFEIIQALEDLGVEADIVIYSLIYNK